MLCLYCGRSVVTGIVGRGEASTPIRAPQVHHRSGGQPAVVTAQPPGSPPPGFTVPPPAPTVPIPQPPRSEIQDTVPRDAPYAPVAATPVEAPRWSGKRTAAIAAIALALTSAGAIAAAAASPSGIAAPSDQRSGPGFGPGGPNRQFRGGGPGQHQGPGQQQAPGQQPGVPPGQQGFGPGQGRSGR